MLIDRSPKRGLGANWTAFLLLACMLILIVPNRASAYLDPGTGSYVLQLALAALLGGMVTLRLYWQKAKDWFRGTKPAEDEKR